MKKIQEINAATPVRTQVFRQLEQAILDGDLVTAQATPTEAMCEMIRSIEDLDDTEIITLFVGDDVTEDQRAEMTEALEENFPDHEIDVYVGGQKIYRYLIAVE